MARLATPAWSDLSSAELRERLRLRSWRTSKLDGVNIRRLVERRDEPEVAEFITEVLGE